MGRRGLVIFSKCRSLGEELTKLPIIKSQVDDMGLDLNSQLMVFEEYVLTLSNRAGIIMQFSRSVSLSLTPSDIQSPVSRRKRMIMKS